MDQHFYFIVFNQSSRQVASRNGTLFFTRLVSFQHLQDLLVQSSAIRGDSHTCTGIGTSWALWLQSLHCRLKCDGEMIWASLPFCRASRCLFSRKDDSRRQLEVLLDDKYVTRSPVFQWGRVWWHSSRGPAGGFSLCALASLFTITGLVCFVEISGGMDVTSFCAELKIYLFIYFFATRHISFIRCVLAWLDQTSLSLVFVQFYMAAMIWNFLRIHYLTFHMFEKQKQTNSWHRHLVWVVVTNSGAQFARVFVLAQTSWSTFDKWM